MLGLHKLDLNDSKEPVCISVVATVFEHVIKNYAYLSAVEVLF